MKQIVFISVLLTSGALSADPATVVNVTADGSDNVYRFNVTIEHPDTGWDHYADGWGEDVYIFDLN